MSKDDGCEFPRCNRPSDMTFIGKRLCDRCYGKWCEEDGEVTLRTKLGLPEMCVWTGTEHIPKSQYAAYKERLEKEQAQKKEAPKAVPKQVRVREAAIPVKIEKPIMQSKEPEKQIAKRGSLPSHALF